MPHIVRSVSAGITNISLHQGTLTHHKWNREKYLITNKQFALHKSGTLQSRTQTVGNRYIIIDHVDFSVAQEAEKKNVFYYFLLYSCLECISCYIQTIPRLNNK